MDQRNVPWGFLVVIAMAASSANSEKFLGTRIGPLVDATHDVSGVVFGLPGKLLLKGFTYDGEGPAGYFYVGVRGDANVQSSPSAAGRIIPDEQGKTSRLGAYDRKTIMLTLPRDIAVGDILWFSVWCTRFAVDFGNVIFPTEYREGQSRKLGGIPEGEHDVQWSSLEFKNEQTIVLGNLRYDGQGPDAFFIMGNNGIGSSGYKKIPDENGRSGVLRGYNGQDITLTLPPGERISQYSYLSIYCVAFTVSFGSANIPQDLKLQELVEVGAPEPTPPSPGIITPLENCEKLGEKMIVAWTLDSTNIRLELIGVIKDSYYMAFGLSGSESRFSMIGSDVIVVSHDDAVGPMATDYTINQYAQCSNGAGACPDAGNGGTSDVMVEGGSKKDGITRVTVVRKRDTGDQKDKVYRAGGQQIIWSIGALNQDRLVTKHERRIAANKVIDFGRQPDKSNCGELTPDVTEPVVPWEENRIVANGNATFTVRIGPTGGAQGYTGITGEQSWGIAYYIQEQLIPVLELTRGNTYTFKVEAGDDSSNTARYHPFYITDDPIGGYVQKTAAEKRNVKVFAGITNDQPSANAVGPYCAYVETDRKADDFDNFADYFRTLQLNCPQPSLPGVLVWKVPLDAPDTLYYQCYTHRRLGWKITFSSANTMKMAASFWVLLLVTSALHFM